MFTVAGCWSMWPLAGVCGHLCVWKWYMQVRAVGRLRSGCSGGVVYLVWYFCCAGVVCLCQRWAVCEGQRGCEEACAVAETFHVKCVRCGEIGGRGGSALESPAGGEAVARVPCRCPKIRAGL